MSNLPTPPPATQARTPLAELWERFRGQFDQQLCVLEEAAMGVLSTDLGSDLRERARAEAHKLAGSLGTFGLPRGSEIAREIETWFGTGGAGDQAANLRLSDAVVALRQCVEAGPLRRADHDPAQGGRAALSVLLVDDDPSFAAALSLETAARGWSLETVAGTAPARQLLTTIRPEVVLMAPRASEVDETLALVRELGAAAPPIPVVMLTRADTFTDRLDVARLGGQVFFPRSMRPADIVAALSEVTDRVRTHHATLLAVDDDPSVLAALTAVLQPEGYRVLTLQEPLRFWDVLTATAPDLVLLDVDMPGVSGIEMCRVMRADQRWAGIPVTFLTVRTDPDAVRGIFAAGADDYVTKPLVGPELKTRVFNRLERSRLLRRLADTDQLTGVGNQRSSAEAMERLLALGERLGQPVAVAMLDVDRLRAVNDTRGYAAGDEILAALGRLLRDTCTTGGVVGRWAGQEFLVALLGLTRSEGVQRLAALLEEFRRERFPDGHGGSLGASFSAGVAQFPEDGADVRLLYRHADQAVRQAKRAGGDRVVAVGWAMDDDSMTDVVLVEDDEPLAQVLLHALATRGYRTQRFADGQEAALALAGPKPKVSARVVVLDWGLPGLDGLRILRVLADTGVLRRTKVVMLTARHSESEVLQALDLGAFDHVAKPFSVPVLMQRVHQAMER